MSNNNDYWRKRARDHDDDEEEDDRRRRRRGDEYEEQQETLQSHKRRRHIEAREAAERAAADAEEARLAYTQAELEMQEEERGEEVEEEENAEAASPAAVVSLAAAIAGRAEGDGGDVEPDIQAPRSVPCDDVDWDAYVETEPITKPDFCFWSEMAHGKHQLEQNQAVQNLVTFHRQNMSKMHPFVFVRKIQDMYNRDLRPYFSHPTDPDRQVRGPMWPARNIYEYTHKIVSPPAIASLVSKIYLDIIVTLSKNQVIETDPSSKDPRARKGNIKAIELFVKVTDKARYWFERVAATRNTDLYSLE